LYNVLFFRFGGTITKEKDKKIELKIAGMTCANCASTIEKSLKKLPGVSKADVNIGTESASVSYNPEKTKIKDVNRAITDVGYQPINEKTVIKIGGMTCAMCVQTIEEALKKIDGVINVTVNLSAEKAFIEYNPKITSIQDFKNVVEKVGYQFLGIEGEQTGDIEEKLRKQGLVSKRNRIIIGFSVSIPLMILMYLPLSWPIPMAYVMFIISTPVFIYISYPIFIAGYRSLKNMTLNMESYSWEQEPKAMMVFWLCC